MSECGIFSDISPVGGGERCESFSKGLEGGLQGGELGEGEVGREGRVGRGGGCVSRESGDTCALSHGGLLKMKQRARMMM